MVPSTPLEFGAALRELRKQLGLSQEATALSLGTTQRHVSFLENGRSAPTRPMLARIVTGLGLSAAQRAALFDASGFRSPYPHRSLDDDSLQESLDLLARRVLHHWPFPGYVLDRDWNFLRTNPSGRRLLDAFGAPANMLTMFLAPAFRTSVTNWTEASGSLYFRLQVASRRSETVRAAFEAAIANGDFKDVGDSLAGKTELPVYVPLVVKIPGGPRLEFTSLLGHLMSVHDAVAEGFEVELLVPLDEETGPAFVNLFGSS